MRRRRGLAHSGPSLGAGITRTDGDDHLELGRRTSSRSCRSSPILAMVPHPQGQAILAGSITRSMRGNSLGSARERRCGRSTLASREAPVRRVRIRELLRSRSRCPRMPAAAGPRRASPISGQTALAKLAHQVLKPGIGFFEKGVLRFEIGLLGLSPRDEDAPHARYRVGKTSRQAP